MRRGRPEIHIRNLKCDLWLNVRSRVFVRLRFVNSSFKHFFVFSCSPSSRSVTLAKTARSRQRAEWRSSWGRTCWTSKSRTRWSRRSESSCSTLERWCTATRTTGDRRRPPSSGPVHSGSLTLDASDLVPSWVHWCRSVTCFSITLSFRSNKLWSYQWLVMTVEWAIKWWLMTTVTWAVKFCWANSKILYNQVMFRFSSYQWITGLVQFRINYQNKCARLSSRRKFWTQLTSDQRTTNREWNLNFSPAPTGAFRGRDVGVSRSLRSFPGRQEKHSFRGESPRCKCLTRREFGNWTVKC